jgi:peptidyl-prolyl cis-trans isomerase C
MFAPRLPIAAVAVALSLALAGPVGAQTGLTLAPAGSADQMQADPATIVAKVGEDAVTLADIQVMYNQLPAQYRQMPMEALYEPLLARAIDQIVLTNAAKASGIAEREDVKARIADATNQVVAEAFITEEITSKITEEALQARYAEVVASEDAEEEAKARHILLESEEDARAIIAELDDGADFASLAEQKSTGPSAAQGGDLGWFKAGQMVPEFSAATFALEPGTYSKDPVQSQFGWHVILLEDKRTADAPSFEQLQDQLTADLTREIYESRMAELRDAVTIERFGPTGEPLPAQ